MVAGAIGVNAACAAGARRGARHGEGLGVPALVEGGGAGDLLRGAPGAVGLGDHERLVVAGAVLVEPAHGAAARPGARHRDRDGVATLVEGGDAGDLLRGAPGAVGLADHERLLAASAVGVPSARGAGARRGARHRTAEEVPALDPGVPAGVEGGGAGDLLGGAPGAVGRADHKRLLAAGAVG